MDAMDGRDRWMHDLNNAINTLGMWVALLRRAIAAGDEQGAQTYLAQIEDSTHQCRELAAAASRDRSDAPGLPPTP